MNASLTLLATERVDVTNQDLLNLIVVPRSREVRPVALPSWLQEVIEDTLLKASHRQEQAA